VIGFAVKRGESKQGESREAGPRFIKAELAKGGCKLKNVDSQSRELGTADSFGLFKPVYETLKSLS
jgi:hypothetical protein